MNICRLRASLYKYTFNILNLFIHIIMNKKGRKKRTDALSVRDSRQSMREFAALFWRTRHPTNKLYKTHLAACSLRPISTMHAKQVRLYKCLQRRIMFKLIHTLKMLVHWTAQCAFNACAHKEKDSYSSLQLYISCAKAI